MTGKNRNGYIYAVLSKNGVAKSTSIHRLVAKAFIPNPLNFREVNHKDENKSNNCVENLEWCTPKYNINYGTGKERALKGRLPTLKRCKTVQKDKQGHIIAIYSSIKEASEKTGFYHQNIQACCAGKIKSCHGFVFEYFKSDTEIEES